MKNVDRYLSAFDRDLILPSEHLFIELTKLYYEDAAAFADVGVAAWAADDLRTMICVGEIALQLGDISPKVAQRLWRSYLRTGRTAEAYRLMLDPRLAGARDQIYWSDMRNVWIGLGRLDMARGVIEENLSAHPPLSPIDAQVIRLEALERDLPSQTSWAPVHELIQGYVALRMFDQAAVAFQTFLAKLPVLEAHDQAEAIETASLIFSFIKPALAPLLLAGVVKWLDPAGDNGKIGREALDLVVAGIDGPCPLGPGDEASRPMRYCMAMACAAAGLHEAAIDLLGRLTIEAPKEVPFRRALAYSVGVRALASHTPSFIRRRERKVFDVFPYNGEKDLLAIKFAEMAGWVDHFVVVEFKQTFTGRPKPAYLNDCKDLLAQYGPKIIHVVEEEFPSYIATPWAREFHQRERGVQALNGLCAEDDLVMLSDADEIADRRALAAFDGDFASLRMDTFRYYLNSRRIAPGADQPRTGSVVRARLLAKYGAALLRTVLGPHRKDDNVFNAGWHFSCLGDASRMAAKMQNSSHQEYAKYQEDHYAEVIALAREGRLEGWETCGVEDLPEYVQRNSATFKAADVLL